MEYKQLNDYELVYMIREKDDYSYDYLLRKYMPIVKRMALDYYRCYSMYGYDLEDFIQEGLLGFQNAVNSFNEEKDILFYTFVTLCIHRSILTFCKRITCEKKNTSRVNFIDLEEVQVADSSLKIESYFVNQEILKKIWEIVYTFPLDYCCVFELRMNHFQYLEISKLLDISVRRTHLMFQRVQERIRKEIDFSF